MPAFPDSHVRKLKRRPLQHRQQQPRPLPVHLHCPQPVHEEEGLPEDAEHQYHQRGRPLVLWFHKAHAVDSSWPGIL
jgi:hypothetical protein